MEDDPDQTKEPAVLARASRQCAAHTAGCPPPPRGKDTRRGQGVRRQTGQVGLPEGEPDRCNPAEPGEGVIPDEDSKDKKLLSSNVLCHY